MAGKMVYTEEQKARRKVACAEWYAANVEKKREGNAKRYAANREKVKEATKKWKEANPEKRREVVRRWQVANPERVREATKKWKGSNPEAILNMPNYIRGLLNLRGVPNIPPELIELKRMQLNLARILKDENKQQNQ